MISIESVIKRINHCGNPLYPDAYAYVRMHSTRVKGRKHRTGVWRGRYARWIDDHDYLASKV